jgi:F-type H+-transporting ATPase subunit b
MLFTNSLVFAEQFGFNTNLLETNVLNLAVVVAVVVIYIGDALKSLLANRKQTILNNFQEADKRALEAESRLKEAQKQFDEAQAKAKQITDQAVLTIERERNQIVQQNQEDIQRLSVMQKEVLQLEQQKAQSELAQKLVKLALHQVNEKLTQRLNASVHSAVNNFQIVLFTNFKPQ